MAFLKGVTPEPVASSARESVSPWRACVVWQVKLVKLVITWSKIDHVARVLPHALFTDDLLMWGAVAAPLGTRTNPVEATSALGLDRAMHLIATTVAFDDYLHLSAATDIDCWVTQLLLD